MWHPAMPPAAMPETSIDEHGEARVSKDEVGTAPQRLMSAPAFYFCGAED
jgi:hypothetical protein